ncbi:MAG: D-alanyl-D-alanine carboxypeptidase/D-alanyl-D-alanine-endopeptidase [Deltaproteobacteria bacterium]|nr:D-alanyl-D-alanine carboxypeptidase/D-alanyl-D-alanine-endopeptidase [Deltaproteobacteria bacterium]
MNTRILIVAALVLALVAPAAAKPGASRGRRAAKALSPQKKGASARVSISRAGELRPAREAIGRREEPLTIEEETAKQIEKLLRGPGLRNGVSGLHVADARTGETLFSLNANEPLNPASNVKMISTATALELLGPHFKYPTRLLGAEPVNGRVHGDVYLLGSYDPTLTPASLEDIAAEVAARGITHIDGNIVVGADPTRDGIFRAIIPIEITAGEPGQPPTAAPPPGAEHVTVVVTATTSKRVMRNRLTFKTETVKTEGAPPKITLTIGGTISKGAVTRYSLWTRERTATAAYAMRAALRAHAVSVSGDMKILELGDYIGDSVGTGTLPVELGRHDSQPLADIVMRVNKWSVNWLADRVIVTAAALARGQQPSMEIALEAMYAWLARNPHVAAKGLVLDTGSGLSYRTQITTAAMVAVVRYAGGFSGGDVDPAVSEAWLDSLSVARNDGTLRHRMRAADLRARVRGKTGTLSTVIAMSGILDIDPARPLAFSLITNTDAPLSKPRVRKAHDDVMATLCTYLVRTTKVPLPLVDPPAPPAAPTFPEDIEETEPADRALDSENPPPDTETTPAATTPAERALDAEAAGVSTAAP